MKKPHLGFEKQVFFYPVGEIYLGFYAVAESKLERVVATIFRRCNYDQFVHCLYFMSKAEFSESFAVS
jgi:hypothetical protein